MKKWNKIEFASCIWMVAKSCRKLYYENTKHTQSAKHIGCWAPVEIFMTLFRFVFAFFFFLFCIFFFFFCIFLVLIFSFSNIMFWHGIYLNIGKWFHFNKVICKGYWSTLFETKANKTLKFFKYFDKSVVGCGHLHLSKIAKENIIMNWNKICVTSGCNSRRLVVPPFAHRTGNCIAEPA